MREVDGRVVLEKKKLAAAAASFLTSARGEGGLVKKRSPVRYPAVRACASLLACKQELLHALRKSSSEGERRARKARRGEVGANSKRGQAESQRRVAMSSASKGATLGKANRGQVTAPELPALASGANRGGLVCGLRVWI